jgi:hypothetical protein
LPFLLCRLLHRSDVSGFLRGMAMELGDTGALAAAARADLAMLAYPSIDRVKPVRAVDGTTVHAVVVVGGGQSGLAISAALRRDGVRDVVVQDRNPAGQEGGWDNFARMRELRTPQIINGMDFGCAKLSVQRWYRARYGGAAWERATRPRRPRRGTTGCGGCSVTILAVASATGHIRRRSPACCLPSRPQACPVTWRRSGRTTLAWTRISRMHFWDSARESVRPQFISIS